MKALQKEYVDRLEIIRGAIQGSDELAAYLDTEEEEEYLKLQEKF